MAEGGLCSATTGRSSDLPFTGGLATQLTYVACLCNFSTHGRRWIEWSIPAGIEHSCRQRLRTPLNHGVGTCWNFDGGVIAADGGFSDGLRRNSLRFVKAVDGFEIIARQSR